jgi:hypothetical protein
VVTCRLAAGLESDIGAPIPPIEFEFTVAGPEREALRGFVAPPDPDEAGGFSYGESFEAPAALRVAGATEPLPSDFPAIHAAVYGTPSPGRLFVCNFVFAGATAASYLMILNDDGTPFFYRKLPRVGLDFKMQPDGRLTYFDAAAGCFYAMNAQYAVIDSFRTGNGYKTDGHDLKLLPNGNALLMSYDPQIVDMSRIAPKDGKSNATVVGLIVQELDPEKNVVFQWRSWDHFQITDVISHSLSGAFIDYVHGNSIDSNLDGNLIISCRHMNEVTKISRATGEIIWRLGGRNNQFTFVGDPLQFSHQHDASRLPNGNLTLFDNGNFRLPLFSRALEYAIDESAKTATLVWQKRLDPDVFAAGFGSVQRLSSGNTLIGWGATTPTLTEVAPDGSIVSQLTFDSPNASYRAFRFEWPPVKPADVEIQPSTIALDGRGGGATATIRPQAADFDVSQVMLSTVRIAGTVAADSLDQADRSVENGEDPLVMVSFNREALLPLLELGLNRIEVSGSLTTGEMFRGFAEVNAVTIRGERAEMAPLRLLSAGGTLPIRLAIGNTYGHEATIAIYDVRGRLVTKLSRKPAAQDVAVWDGTAADGRRVGAGVYLIRREGGTSSPVLKVVVVR